MPDAKPKSGSRLFVALVVGAAVLVVAVIAVYGARRTIAREVLTGWLEQRGIASRAEVREIGPGRFVGRIQIGDPKAPDFAGDAEVTYGWRGFSPEVRSVRLTRPVLRARIKDGQIRMGALDPLIAEFRKRPPRPDAAQPRIEIDDAQVWLATDYGPVRLDADARLEDGKLMALAATSQPARLTGPGFTANVGRSVLALKTVGSRISARLEAPVAGATSGDLAPAALTGGQLLVTADAPYPDLVKRRGDGALTVAAKLTADRCAAGDRFVRAPVLEAGFAGQVTGWIANLAVAGKATASLSAQGGAFAPAEAGVVKAALTSDDLRWTRAGGDRVSATLRLTGTADRFRAADLTLSDLVVAAKGPLSADKGGLRLAMGGSAVGRGRWTGMGAPTAKDSADMAAIKRAAAGFRFAAPAVQVAVGPAVSGRLVQPLRIMPDRGGEVRLAQAGSTWRLTAAGGGLPTVDAGVANFRFGSSGATGDLVLKTGISLGPIVGGKVDAAGRMRVANGALTLIASRCARVSADRLEFGERDVERLAGQLCPAKGPLFTFGGGGWRVSGRAQGVSASVPFFQVQADEMTGPVTLGLSGAQLYADLTADRVRLTDAASPTRFNPLVLTGRAELAKDVWNGAFVLATPGGAKLADARLRHEMLTGGGGVEIDTGVLRFAEGGLQPAQLSPLVAALGTPAVGEVRFGGTIGWLPDVGISAGKLDVLRLDFKSPAGQVTGLSGSINLTSLIPLVAAPGQTFKAERLDALVPLTGLEAALELRADRILLTGGQASVEGGRVRIESLDLPLTPDAPIKGLLSLEGVQLKNLVEASPFGSWMDMDAVVTGRIPFESQGGKVRIAAGDLSAIQPGRISINRELFTGGLGGKVDATSPAPPPDPNQTFTDMAYQAMEDLAFTELAATLNSQADGRMGVLFHIKGRHDPPQKKQIKLGLMDLIQQKFMGKPLPLPSGTQVNLTLDTTLNLDQLLADYAEYRRSRGSAAVQP